MMTTSDLHEDTAFHFCSPELCASCAAGSDRAQRILLRESLHSILGFSQLLTENNAVSNELRRRRRRSGGRPGTRHIPLLFSRRPH
jgi:hypothetical protein